MKCVEVKIFNVLNQYFVVVEKICFKKNIKLLEEEFIKEFNDLDDLKYYLTNVLNTKELRKDKIFINYISNDVIIEVINNNTNLKIDYHKEINKLYPNYNFDYNLLIGELKIKLSYKKGICALVKKDVYKSVTSLLSFVGKEKIYYGLDPLLLQLFLNDKLNNLNHQFIILIQKNFNFYRFYKVLNGKIIDYIVLKDDINLFDQMFNKLIYNITSKINEVIFEGPYNLYKELVDKLQNISVIYLDSIDYLKNIDERKITYGKKKL